MTSDPAAATPARPRLRRWIATLTAFSLILVAAVVASYLVYFRPASDPYRPGEVDAVLVLGPPTPERIAFARKISSESRGVPIYLSVWKGVVCRPEFRCVHADPWTTKGEAAALREIIARDNVRRPVVLTGTTHVPRARYIFHRCVDPAVPVVEVVEDVDLGQTLAAPVYQTAAFVKAWATPCD